MKVGLSLILIAILFQGCLSSTEIKERSAHPSVEPVTTGLPPVTPESQPEAKPSFAEVTLNNISSTSITSTPMILNDTERFLLEGTQTKTTQRIKQISEQIRKNNNDSLMGTFNWMEKNLRNEDKHPNKMKLFRKRTADEIISSGFATGCTDRTLVFVALMRAQQVPASYVETVSEDWLKDQSAKSITGHVFSRVYIDDEWVWVDPTRRKYGSKSVILQGYEIYDEGVDSWDLNITSIQDMVQLFGLRYNKTST